MLLGSLLTRATVYNARRLIISAPVTHNLRLISQTAARYTKDPLDLSQEKMQKFVESLRCEFYALRNSPTEHTRARVHKLNGVVSALEQYRLLKSKISTQADIDKETDEEMRQLLQEESEVYGGLLRETEQTLLTQLLLLSEEDTYNSLIFEINAGAGGQEAMLFAKELFDMYTNFFEHSGWAYEIVAQEETEIGGLRHGNVIVQDSEAFSQLRYEAGVHRVQRVPTTEKSGRMHTSTASVTVIPRPDDVEVTLADKDLKIETKRASGAGGQHVNTTDSAVRVVHLPTGLAIECQTERSQLKNREMALQRLQAKLLQRLLESNESTQKKTRKAQQGNLNRNEKIRTYNFVQDRITDHRIQNGTMHNLRKFLDGDEDLGRMIERVAAEQRRTRLIEMVNNFKDVEDAAQSATTAASTHN